MTLVVTWIILLVIDVVAAVVTVPLEGCAVSSATEDTSGLKSVFYSGEVALGG